MPLDLHVLSLPLAFILSQDQTLRCYILFILFFTKYFRHSPKARLRLFVSTQASFY